MSQEILPIPKHYSDDLKNMIEVLLKKNASLRPSINDILIQEHISEKMKKYGLTNETNISPVNKNDAEINYNLLNLNFENLLITENDSNIRVNTASTTKFNSKIFQDSENKFTINSVKNKKISNKKIFSSNKDKNLNCSEFFLEGDSSTLFKNQYSVPELLNPNKSLLITESPSTRSQIQESKFN
jgi:hypothetical protein